MRRYEWLQKWNYWLGLSLWSTSHITNIFWYNVFTEIQRILKLIEFKYQRITSLVKIVCKIEIYGFFWRFEKQLSSLCRFQSIHIGYIFIKILTNSLFHFQLPNWDMFIFGYVMVLTWLVFLMFKLVWPHFR